VNLLSERVIGTGLVPETVYLIDKKFTSAILLSWHVSRELSHPESLTTSPNVAIAVSRPFSVTTTIRPIST